MADIMIDLETLSTEPNAAIVQIGACAFNRNTGEIGQILNIRVKPDLTNRHVSYDTLQWWMSQTEEARTAVFGTGAHFSQKLYGALKSLSAFVWRCSSYSDDTCVWAMPPTFDCTILENAYSQYPGLRVPWGYDKLRDVRTVLDLAGFSKEDRVKPEVAHDALSDAVAQAKTVAQALQVIRGGGV